MTTTMLWDPSFDSWRHYEIYGQPAAVLLAPDGEPIRRWSGPFDPDEVLELAARYG